MIIILLFLLLLLTVFSVESKSLMRCAVALGGVGIIMGLIFISLKVYMVGVFQMAVYGGITAVLIFVLSMLSGGKDEN